MVVAQSPSRLVRKAVLLQRRIGVIARFPLMDRVAAAHEVSYVLADQIKLDLVRLLGILVAHFRQCLCIKDRKNLAYLQSTDEVRKLKRTVLDWLVSRRLGSFLDLRV